MWWKCKIERESGLPRCFAAARFLKKEDAMRLSGVVLALFGEYG